MDPSADPASPASSSSIAEEGLELAFASLLGVLEEVGDRRAIWHAHGRARGL